MGILQAFAPQVPLVCPLCVAPARRLDAMAWAKSIDFYALSCGPFRKPA